MVDLFCPHQDPFHMGHRPQDSSGWLRRFLLPFKKVTATKMCGNQAAEVFELTLKTKMNEALSSLIVLELNLAVKFYR